MIVCSAVMMQNECLYRQYHDRRSWLFSKQPSLSAVNTTHHYNDTSYPSDPMYCEIELSELGTTGRWHAWFVCKLLVVHELYHILYRARNRNVF